MVDGWLDKVRGKQIQMRKKQGIFKMAWVNFIYFPHGCVLGRRRFNVETPRTSLNEEGIGLGWCLVVDLLCRNDPSTTFFFWVRRTIVVVLSGRGFVK